MRDEEAASAAYVLGASRRKMSDARPLMLPAQQGVTHNMSLPQDDMISALFQELSHKMVKIAFQRLKDRGLAEDAVSETFITAMLRREELAQHPNPAGWLYRTLYYVTARELSRPHRQKELPMLFDMESEETLPQQLREELPQRLADRLPPDLSDVDRETLLLHFELDLSCQQIAQRNGITEGAARMRLLRAIRRCRTYFEDAVGH